MTIAQEIRSKIEANKKLYASFGISSPHLDKLIEEHFKNVDELVDIITSCETNEQKIRHAETDEEKSKSMAILQPILEKFNIRTEAAAKESCVSFAPEVIEKEEMNAANNGNQEGNIFTLVNDQEYNAVPKYLRGRMLLGDLNSIISSMDNYMNEKHKLMRRPLKALKAAEKNRVISWREQDVSKCDGQICMTEAELKAVLAEKLKVQLKHALPVLRHLHITKEIRNKQTLFICPYF